MNCNRPYEIQWNKLFQIEGQEKLDVNIKDIDIDIDNEYEKNIDL